MFINQLVQTGKESYEVYCAQNLVTNHSSDCYFCLVDPSKCRSEKNTSATRYPDIPFLIAPVPHSAQLLVPTPTLLPKKKSLKMSQAL